MEMLNYRRLRHAHDQTPLYVWYSFGRDRRAMQKIQIQQPRVCVLTELGEGTWC